MKLSKRTQNTIEPIPQVGWARITPQNSMHIAKYSRAFNYLFYLSIWNKITNGIRVCSSKEVLEAFKNEPDKLMSAKLYLSLVDKRWATHANWWFENFSPIVF